MENLDVTSIFKNNVYWVVKMSRVRESPSLESKHLVVVLVNICTLCLNFLKWILPTMCFLGTLFFGCFHSSLEVVLQIENQQSCFDIRI